MRNKYYGGICLPFHYESEAKYNLQIFTCNRFCAQGNFSELLDVAQLNKEVFRAHMPETSQSHARRRQGQKRAGC